MNKKILLLRNDPRERRALSLLLVDAGFFVASFERPQDALAVAKHEEFDLVVSDYHKEGENGFGFVKAIKDSQPWMPVMVISSDLEMDQVIEALRLKVKDLFIPPFETSEFLDSVVKLLCPEEEVSKPKYSDQDMHEMSSLLLGKFSLEGNGRAIPRGSRGKQATLAPDLPTPSIAPTEGGKDNGNNEELNKIIEDLRNQLSEKEKALTSG
ncbi:MAG: response regulator, partial [Verrucomicrobiae bacterium]|nr:response regulator [Verrucomicrobiae bacterium]